MRNQAYSLIGRKVRLTYCIRREYGEGRFDRDEVIEGILTLGRSYLVTTPGFFAQGHFINIGDIETFLCGYSLVSNGTMGMNGAYTLEVIG